MTTPLSYCVFRLRTGWVALDALLVGEVADLAGIVPLPACAPAVLGLAALRGRALAVVDLAGVLGEPAPGETAPDRRCLVLRLPGRECAAAIERVEGVLPADPAGRRNANHLAEPPWISGFQAFPGATGQDGTSLVAAIIDPPELARRLDTLRFASTSRI